MYEVRTYRQLVKGNDLVPFTAMVKESDLFIRAERDLTTEAVAAIIECRRPLEQYIQVHPLFLHSLKPLEVADDAPAIVRTMAKAGQMAKVGPMAAVAGAIAEMVGEKLLRHSGEVIVENGGDIFIQTKKKRLVGIYAGESPFSGKMAIEVGPGLMPMGVCTSSGTVGPSFSMGLADAAIILSHSAALSDAVATAAGNLVQSEDDIPAALESIRKIKGVLGIAIIKGERMGAWGDINLVRI